MIDVLVIGGGNAALCAALMAREAGASVMLLEGAPKIWRGGNSQHTRNLRCMHEAPQDVLVDAYPEEEYWQDLLKVTGGITNEKLARIVIRASSNCRDWMRSHGVHFQPSLSGALQVARTNAFFMGGGKALVNSYFRSAERLGVKIRYNAQVTDIEMKGGEFVAAYIGEREVDGQRLPAERIQAKACVLAAGGFESNREWLREAWGQNERGEWPSDNFLIRGTRFNTGVLLRRMQSLGADFIGDPTQAHMVAIDARAPCMTVVSAPVSIAYRWAWWLIATANASMTRAKISGPSAMRSGAAWWPVNPVNRPTRSSTNKPSAVSCLRCLRVLKPTPCKTWPAS